jgi:hypothetical protein
MHRRWRRDKKNGIARQRLDCILQAGKNRGFRQPAAGPGRDDRGQLLAVGLDRGNQFGAGVAANTNNAEFFETARPHPATDVLGAGKLAAWQNGEKTGAVIGTDTTTDKAARSAPSTTIKHVTVATTFSGCGSKDAKIAHLVCSF